MNQPSISTPTANAIIDAMCALMNGGTLNLYDGKQPADCDTAPVKQTRLATLVIGTPAYSAAVAGVATNRPFTADPDAAATGTASWYRVNTRGGVAVQDGSVGDTDDFDLVMNSVVIVQHAEVSVDELLQGARRR